MVDRFFLSNFLSRLSLEVMTLNPVCENVETAQGVPLTVTGVAQVYASVVYCTVLYCSVLCCTVLYCIVLNFTVL